MSITSPLVQPSPNGRRVGIRIVTFEACSGFTRVTARRIAQPPKVTFITRLRFGQLPSETARQLPDLSTIIRVEPSSTDDSRPQRTAKSRRSRGLPHSAAVDPNSKPVGERLSPRVIELEKLRAHPAYTSFLSLAYGRCTEGCGIRCKIGRRPLLERLIRLRFNPPHDNSRKFTPPRSTRWNDAS